MIRSSPELAAQIDAAVGAMDRSLPCWRQGFCHQSRPFPMATIVDAHKALQNVFLVGFGTDLCRSGDALVYFRGRPWAPLTTRPQLLEMFALITTQCLNPKRSILLLLHAPSRDMLQPADRVHCIADADPAGAIALPPELQVISGGVPPARPDSSAWCFRISTALVFKLLMLSKEFNVTWDVSLLNYTHKSPNVLSVKDCRERHHLFGPVLFENPPRADPLGYMEWADLCNDDEALGEDRDFAAAFAAEELAPPAAPAGPPPGVVLPPPPPPVALAPLAPGAIKVEGNLVYLAGAPRPIGRQSALVHWYPPRVCHAMLATWPREVLAHRGLYRRCHGRIADLGSACR